MRVAKSVAVDFGNFGRVCFGRDGESFATLLWYTTGCPGTNSAASALRPIGAEGPVLAGSLPSSVADVRWPPNARRPVGRGAFEAGPETPVWRLEGLFRFPRDR